MVDSLHGWESRNRGLMSSRKWIKRGLSLECVRANRIRMPGKRVDEGGGECIEWLMRIWREKESSTKRSKQIDQMMRNVLRHANPLERYERTVNARLLDPRITLRWRDQVHTNWSSLVTKWSGFQRRWKSCKGWESFVRAAEELRKRDLKKTWKQGVTVLEPKRWTGWQKQAGKEEEEHDEGEGWVRRVSNYKSPSATSLTIRARNCWVCAESHRRRYDADLSALISPGALHCADHNLFSNWFSGRFCGVNSNAPLERPSPVIEHVTIKTVLTFIILSPVVEHMVPFFASIHTILAFATEHLAFAQVVTCAGVNGTHHRSHFLVLVFHSTHFKVTLTLAQGSSLVVRALQKTRCVARTSYMCHLHALMLCVAWFSSTLPFTLCFPYSLSSSSFSWSSSSSMWVTRTLRTLVNEETVTMAENNPLTLVLHDLEFDEYTIDMALSLHHPRARRCSELLASARWGIGHHCSWSSWYFFGTIAIFAWSCLARRYNSLIHVSVISLAGANLLSCMSVSICGCGMNGHHLSRATLYVPLSRAPHQVFLKPEKAASVKGLDAVLGQVHLPSWCFIVVRRGGNAHRSVYCLLLFGLSSAGVTPLPPWSRMLPDETVKTFIVCPSWLCLLDGEDNCMLSVPSSTCDLLISCWQSAKFPRRWLVKILRCSTTHCVFLPNADDLFSVRTCCLANVLLAPRFPSSRPDTASIRSLSVVATRILLTRGRLAFAQDAVRVSSFQSPRLVMHVVTCSRWSQRAFEKCLFKRCWNMKVLQIREIVPTFHVSAPFSTICSGYAWARSKCVTLSLLSPIVDHESYELT